MPPCCRQQQVKATRLSANNLQPVPHRQLAFEIVANKELGVFAGPRHKSHPHRAMPSCCACPIEPATKAFHASNSVFGAPGFPCRILHRSASHTPYASMVGVLKEGLIMRVYFSPGAWKANNSITPGGCWGPLRW